MAFVYTRDPQVGHADPLLVVTGTWTNSGSTTGGEVETGLNTVLFAYPEVTGAAGQTKAAFNETFPFSAGAITLASTSGYTGVWIAVGY